MSPEGVQRFREKDMRKIKNLGRRILTLPLQSGGSETWIQPGTTIARAC